jgi:hypothetical protein
MGFGRDGNADSQIGIGWSPSEVGFRWMIDDVSRFWLDNPSADPCVLDIDLHPFVHLPSVPKQRVTIEIGGTEVFRADLSKQTVCSIPVPAASSPGSRIHVTIRHPDAKSPRDLTGDKDPRKLALAVRHCRTRPPVNGVLWQLPDAGAGCPLSPHASGRQRRYRDLYCLLQRGRR